MAAKRLHIFIFIFILSTFILLTFNQTDAVDDNAYNNNPGGRKLLGFFSEVAKRIGGILKKVVRGKVTKDIIDPRNLNDYLKLACASRGFHGGYGCCYQPLGQKCSDWCCKN